ncbi:hypothetical protein KOSB73_220154 [Klebsiella grimontii]|uniref:Uncharacterized protein n=1 Tax=Klebsiella grimontii TaxID=2058152 RepID=A0A285AZE0_9ENTR|nr:hypothetical protein KOSB73_220154 [Klebsiella grimontii]
MLNRSAIWKRVRNFPASAFPEAALRACPGYLLPASAVPANPKSSPNCNLSDICAFYCLGRTEEVPLCLVSTMLSMTCGLRQSQPPGRKRC